jgi:hypothetical protein
MKKGKEKKTVNKFDLERFEIAKLKNSHLIKGGGGNGPKDDPIDTNRQKAKGSSLDCDN